MSEPNNKDTPSTPPHQGAAPTQAQRPMPHAGEAQAPAPCSMPHAAEGDRPLISFCLFAYNQEQYIREAVEGAFSQTYSPLEIILSDDCSTDRTFDIIQEMAAGYTGHHTIKLNRNNRNIGLGSHVNKVFSLASGDLYIMAAGDDVSLPNRVSCVARGWFEAEKPWGVFSNGYTIDENGQITRDSIRSWSTEREKKVKEESDKCKYKNMAGKQCPSITAVGASAAWSREIMDVFGPLGKAVQNEDMVLSYRCNLLDRIVYLDELLLKRRLHTHNLFGESSPTFWKQRVLRQRQIITYKKQMIKDIKRVPSLNPKEKKFRIKSISLKMRTILKYNIISSFFSAAKLLSFENE